MSGSDQTPAPSSKRFLTPRFSSSARQSAAPSFTQKQSPSCFEDDALTLSDSRRLHGCTPRATDAIDDADTAADVELADTDHNLDADLIGGKGTQNYNVQGAVLVTPHPRKRRKVATTPTKQANEALVIPSSPSNPASDASVDGGNDSSSDLELDPDSPSSRRATARHGSRFKMVPSQAMPLRDDTENKPVFRQPDPKLQIAAEMATVLPDAFTPSRRKGKKEYLPGGLADSIRNTVLGIALEISQTSGQRQGTLVSVKSAHADASGRAILATSQDGHYWILPALRSRRGESEELSQQVRSIRSSGFLLFGSASYWPLPNGSTDSGETARFASHWKIPAPGDWNK
ncbi:hypothetical protein DV735_g2710, partial [Chaetothyriales sp. CBS 134920]